MSSSRARQTLLLVVVGALTGQSVAHGFECTTTDTHDFVSIRWMKSPITYAIQAPGPTRTSTQTALDALVASFAAWSSPRCTHVQFQDMGTVEASTPASEVNQVIFVSQNWDLTRDPVAVGLTTMTYSTVDGTISHGIIEVNETFEFVDLDGGQPCGLSNRAYDLQAVLTHEVGHFIGLAHVIPGQSIPTTGPDAATMSPTVEQCDSNYRSLEIDDQDGLCFVYPTGQRARGCATLPRATSVGNQPFGCSGAGHAYAARWTPLVWGFGVLVSLASRRRRRRRRSTSSAG